MCKLFTQKMCGEKQGARFRAAAALIVSIVPNIPHILAASSPGAHSSSLGQMDSEELRISGFPDRELVFIYKVLLSTDSSFYCE